MRSWRARCSSSCGAECSSASSHTHARFQSFGSSSTNRVRRETLREHDGGFLGGDAFFGGIVSFLSPCVLPLVPVYLANLAGEAMRGTGDVKADRRRVFLHSVVFVIGFTLVFAFVGASAGFLGTLVQEQLDTVTRIGGVLLVVFRTQIAAHLHPVPRRTYQLSATGRAGRADL